MKQFIVHLHPAAYGFEIVGVKTPEEAIAVAKQRWENNPGYGYDFDAEDASSFEVVCETELSEI